MDVLINFIVLILVSLLNIHWLIFIVLCFVVPLWTGHLKVPDGVYFDATHDNFSDYVWTIVFPATLVVAYLFQRFIVKDAFGFQSLIAIGIMVFTLSEITKIVRRRKKPDTDNGDKTEQKPESGNCNIQSTQYDSDPYVAEYAKRRANGICDLCEQSAPFNKKNGDPYLEAHHIIWLSKGGNDTIENTVALCPNCHQKIHVLDLYADKKTLEEKYNVHRQRH